MVEPFMSCGKREDLFRDLVEDPWLVLPANPWWLACRITHPYEMGLTIETLTLTSALL